MQSFEIWTYLSVISTFFQEENFNHIDYGICRIHEDKEDCCTVKNGSALYRMNTDTSSDVKHNNTLKAACFSTLL